MAVATTSPFATVSEAIEEIRKGRFVVVVDAPPLPTSKDQCKQGGYAALGFTSQGKCVAFVQRGPSDDERIADGSQSSHRRRSAPRPGGECADRSRAGASGRRGHR